MSVLACDCPCPTGDTIVSVPGSPGEPGAAGTNGTNGINAFTTLTANLTLPAAAGPVVSIVSVGVSDWAAINQIIFISDGTNQAHFKVLSKPNSASFTLEWLDYPSDSAGTTVIASGADVSPSGILVPGPTPIAEGGTGAILASVARQNLGVGGESEIIYASGTAYSLTATPALLNFGTVDPSITLTRPGVWLIMARARIDNNAKTTAAVRTITLKLRRTNNTAADIANSSSSCLTAIMTTLTFTLTIMCLPPIIYTTTASDDIIQLWGSADDISGAGTFDAVEASIVAVRLYDQTV